jgi:hypothetical protein
MRGLYEGYAQGLSDYLQMRLPPWIASEPHKDNWQVVSKVRARTEAANQPAGKEISSAASLLAEEHHDF